MVIQVLNSKLGIILRVSVTSATRDVEAEAEAGSGSGGSG